MQKKDFPTSCQACNVRFMTKQRKKPQNKAQNKPSNKIQRRVQSKEPRPSLYGVHAVQEAWLNENRVVDALYATNQALNGFADALNEARQKGLKRPEPSIVDKQQLESLLPQGAVHQGLALACSGIPECDLQDLLIRASSKDRQLLLILDQVTDPHNVGAILRSACAFGVDGMIMQKKHAPELTGVLAKTACGAIEHVPVAYETNLSRTIEALQADGFFVYGLDERGLDIGEQGAFPEKSVLVLGAEGPGLRRLVKEHCDQLLRLPMHGPMPSINVSNAAAVALYAFCIST